MSTKNETKNEAKSELKEKMKEMKLENVDYLKTLKEVKQFLQDNEDFSPVELMMEFCSKNDLEICELADIISEDKELIKYIESRCVTFKIFQ